MGIKIKRDGKGGYRRWWYAEYKEDGKLRIKRLDVKVAGTPPVSLSIREDGDMRYEKSKSLAQKAFDDFMDERQRKGATNGLMETLIESKIGEKPSYIRLEELPNRWNGLPREKELCEDRKKSNDFVFREFAASCGKKFLYQVNEEDVKRYFTEIKHRLAWATVKSRMSLLSCAFARFLPKGCRNYFKSILKRKTGSAADNFHRIPLTNEQLQKLRETARSDPFLYPLVECGIATGARLRDICVMRKDSIDLREGFVTYVSTKTGIRSEIPLFNEFRRICEDIIYNGDPSEPLLFPDAANMYEHNRTGIVRRGKLLFAKALFGGVRKADEPTEIIDGEPLPPKSPAEVLNLIDSAKFTPAKTLRMKDVYTRYSICGESYRKIEAKEKIPRQTICGYLQEIERLTGQKVIRFAPGSRPTQLDLIRRTRQERTDGSRAASKYGWGSLRATFVVLAMEHRVPEKEIINAVGHADFKTTLKYYDNPTRAHQKEMWLQRMSSTAIGQSDTLQTSVMTIESAKAIISTLTPQQIQAMRLLRLLEAS